MSNILRHMQDFYEAFCRVHDEPAVPNPYGDISQITKPTETDANADAFVNLIDPELTANLTALANDTNTDSAVQLLVSLEPSPVQLVPIELGPTQNVSSPLLRLVPIAIQEILQVYNPR